MVWYSYNGLVYLRWFGIYKLIVCITFAVMMLYVKTSGFAAKVEQCYLCYWCSGQFHGLLQFSFGMIFWKIILS